MRYLVSTVLIIAVLAGPAWGNSCYEKAISFKTVPHDRPFTITLEARRVKAVRDNQMTYDLGKETIVIQADSFGAQRFLKDVTSSRCSARETVTLQPERKSPFNTKFKAIDPRARPH
ncbi:MAG: hypothetical protein WCY54_10780 [Syntrophales bacterium]